MIKGLFVLLLFQCLGEAIKAVTGIILPGPVIGMLLLFFTLCLLRHTPSSVGEASQGMIKLLPLLFMPASAGLFFLDPRFNQQWLAIGGAIVVATILSLLFNGWLMKQLLK
jgi:holin-like protein